jgi:hypothetical protein
MDIAVSAGCGTADGDAVLAIMKKKLQDREPIRLRLSARSANHSVVFFSHKKISQISQISAQTNRLSPYCT